LEIVEVRQRVTEELNPRAATVELPRAATEKQHRRVAAAATREKEFATVRWVTAALRDSAIAVLHPRVFEVEA